MITSQHHSCFQTHNQSVCLFKGRQIVMFLFGEKVCITLNNRKRRRELSQDIRNKIIDKHGKGKRKAPDDVFLTIQPMIGPSHSNGKDFRFEFIGNFNNKNGTLKFSDVTLNDEGSYTCIFSLFPSGKQSRNSQLVILEGNEEVPLATCTAAASKPKADVRWIKGSLEGKVREELKETQHANGTTTTWSTLLGKPGREMNGQLVKCVISSEATKEDILETNILVHSREQGGTEGKRVPPQPNQESSPPPRRESPTQGPTGEGRPQPQTSTPPPPRSSGHSPAPTPGTSQDPPKGDPLRTPGSHPPGPRLVQGGARQGPAAPAQEGGTPRKKEGPQGVL
uniref:Ig-like domain-containing protein n=1 Tax=Oryzias latipes TaxID=8090 RepID=A0A3B3IFI8_ORYLA